MRPFIFHIVSLRTQPGKLFTYRNSLNFVLLLEDLPPVVELVDGLSHIWTLGIDALAADSLRIHHCNILERKED